MKVKKFRDTVKIVLMPGLEVQICSGGTWMCFDGDKRSGAIRLESMAENGTIFGSAIANWCETVRTNPRFQL
jgi:hypothetical protein